MATVTLTRVQPEFGFEVVDEHGINMRMDTSADHGGQGFGVSPMKSLLMALGGCSAMDVVSILNKYFQR